MTFRFPGELAQAIASQARAMGTDKTTVVVEALSQALGLQTDSPSLTMPAEMQEQFNDLSEKLALLLEQQRQLRQQLQIAPRPPTDQNGQEPTLALERSRESPLAAQPEAALDLALEVSFEEQLASQQQLIKQLQHQVRTLNQILAAAPDLVFVQDRMGRYTYINPAGARAFGFESSYFLGKTFEELEFPTALTESFVAQRQAVFANRRLARGKSACRPPRQPGTTTIF